MIQIDIVPEAHTRYGKVSGRRVTGEDPLVIVRQLQNALTLRFCNASGGADTGVTNAMLTVPKCWLTIGDRILATTDSGYTVSVGTDGVLEITFSHLVTDTEAVRRLMADDMEAGCREGVACWLEFSSRSSSTDSDLSLWCAIPVRLLNPQKVVATPADTPETQNLYLTAAETRTAIHEEVAAQAQSSGVSSCTILPYHGRIYTKTLSSGDAFIFSGTLTDAVRLTFELHLTQPATAVSFSWSSTIWWMDDSGHFAATNSAPDFSTANQLYALVFRYDGARWLGNLAYTR